MPDESSKSFKNEKLVSVVIPCYKAEKYIETTVVSVLEQTYQNLEVIVVIDGSPENEIEVLEGLSKRDLRLKVIEQKNLGVSQARNNGYKVTKGDYISFLDSDDVWLPSRLEKLINKFENGNFGLVQSDVEVIDQNGRRTGEIKHGKEGNVLEDLLLWNGDVINAPSSVLVKREALEEVGLFDHELSTAADQELWFRIASKYEVGLVSEPLSYYRKHEENMSSNISLLEKDHLIAYKKAEKNGLFKSNSFKNQCFSNMTMIIAACWIGDGKDFAKGLKLLIKSILLYPPNSFKLMSIMKERLNRV
ncbi:glycosyltransferase [Reichenbachiella sp.]|uniref:glycosyltransferase family 2 protein n=1 Tax=Reichenbachiella sp. TaxID=2184521 RepID=UPI0032973248